MQLEASQVCQHEEEWLRAEEGETRLKHWTSFTLALLTSLAIGQSGENPLCVASQSLTHLVKLFFPEEVGQRNFRSLFKLALHL